MTTRGLSQHSSWPGKLRALGGGRTHFVVVAAVASLTGVEVALVSCSDSTETTFLPLPCEPEDPAVGSVLYVIESPADSSAERLIQLHASARCAGLRRALPRDSTVTALLLRHSLEDLGLRAGPIGISGASGRRLPCAPWRRIQVADGDGVWSDLADGLPDFYGRIGIPELEEGSCSAANDCDSRCVETWLCGGVSSSAPRCARGCYRSPPQGGAHGGVGLGSGPANSELAACDALVLDHQVAANSYGDAYGYELTISSQGPIEVSNSVHPTWASPDCETSFACTTDDYGRRTHRLRRAFDFYRYVYPGGLSEDERASFEIRARRAGTDDLFIERIEFPREPHPVRVELEENPDGFMLLVLNAGPNAETRNSLGVPDWTRMLCQPGYWSCGDLDPAYPGYVAQRLVRTYAEYYRDSPDWRGRSVAVWFRNPDTGMSASTKLLFR